MPSRLGQILSTAEQRFGERDKSYTILGIEFGATVPHLWYPGDRKDVIVQLAMNAINDECLAVYQMAHESIHLLAPSGQKRALVLEEGLAAVFAQEFTLQHFGRFISSGDLKYDSAAVLTRTLLLADPDSVKKLRALHPSFCDISEQDILDVVPNISADVATRLTLDFYTI